MADYISILKMYSLINYYVQYKVGVFKGWPNITYLDK